MRLKISARFFVNLKNDEKESNKYDKVAEIYKITEKKVAVDLATNKKKRTNLNVSSFFLKNNHMNF